MAEACQIRLYDRATGKLIRTFDAAQAVTRLAFNHAGDRLTATGWSAVAEMFDVGTGQKLFTSRRLPYSQRFSPDDRYLAGTIITASSPSGRSRTAGNVAHWSARG
jgi:WD40 repeat protein